MQLLALRHGRENGESQNTNGCWVEGGGEGAGGGGVGGGGAV